MPLKFVTQMFVWIIQKQWRQQKEKKYMHLVAFSPFCSKSDTLEWCKCFCISRLTQLWTVSTSDIAVSTSVKWHRCFCIWRPIQFVLYLYITTCFCSVGFNTTISICIVPHMFQHGLDDTTFSRSEFCRIILYFCMFQVVWLFLDTTICISLVSWTYVYLGIDYVAKLLFHITMLELFVSSTEKQ